MLSILIKENVFTNVWTVDICQRKGDWDLLQNQFINLKNFDYVFAIFDNGCDIDGAAVTFNIPIHPLFVNSVWCAWNMYCPGLW